MTTHDDLRNALRQAVQPTDELTSRMLAGVESKLKAKSQPTLITDMFALGWTTLTTLLGSSLSSHVEPADRTLEDRDSIGSDRKDVNNG